MKHTIKLATKLALLALPLAFAGCSSDDPDTTTDLTIEVVMTYGNEPLRLTGDMNINGSGESFTLDDFKFYMSNLVLTDADGNEFAEPKKYHLVRQINNNHVYEITWSDLPTGEYRNLRFMVGVDPEANLSIDQVGDLDPTNQMAWNWNTGYKFLLAEGFYVPGGIDPVGLVFHIGGNDNLQNYSLDLPAGSTFSANTTLQLQARADRVFDGPNTISFAQNNDVQGGQQASLVAENIGNGFITFSSLQ